MPIAATKMDLDIITLSKTEKNKYHVSYMWNQKKKKTHTHTNEVIFKTERDSQMYEDKHMITKGEKVGQGEE